MYTYTIAARYLFKRPISYVAILLVAFIVWMYLMVISVLEGFKDHYMDKIQNINAHVTVDVGNYASGIAHPAEWSAEIAKLEPGIKGVSVGIETPSMAVFSKDRTIGVLRGIDLPNELKVGRLNEILKPADLKDFGTQEFNNRKFNGCIVGGMWRKNFHLKLNERITFLFTDDSDQANTVSFNIVGFYEGKNPFLENGAYVDRTVLANLVKVPGRAKTLYIWLKDPNRADLKAFKERVAVKMREIITNEDKKLTAEILELLKTSDPAISAKISSVFSADETIAKTAIGLLNGRDAAVTDKALELLRAKNERYAEKLIESLNRENRANKVSVETWQEKDNNFYESVSRENQMMRVIMGVFLALTAFILFLIFGRLVAEKVRDIGALRAQGAAPGGILLCFLIQGLFIGVIGVGLGLGLAELFLHYMNDIPWLRNNLYPDEDKIPYMTLNYDRFLIVGLTLFSALAGAFFPAWRASRLNPVECLRHE
ncbi:MAG: FtsX-like permease family protein [Planctomycetota bacterium]